MTNANINSLTLTNSVAAADKFYVAQSPFASGNDRAVLASAINSSFDHDILRNYVANQHRAMGTDADSLTVWSGYHINSLFATKQNSVNLETYATSANLTAHTGIDSIHRGMATEADTIVTWSGYHINSLFATKLNSTNLATYATSTNLAAHTSISSIHRGMATAADTIVTWSGYHINSLFNTKQNSVNPATYATSANLAAHTSISSIHRGMATAANTIVTWSGYHINSLFATKLNSTNLSTYATSAGLANHINSIQLHTNHNSVFIQTGAGLSGGGDITATRTITLDINGMTAISTVDPGEDYLGIHSTGITSLRKVKPFEFWGITETTQITTTAYSVQNTDFGKHLEFTGTAAQTVTLANDDTLSWPVDGCFMWTCMNTNGLSFTGGTSSTVNHVSGYTTVSSLYAVGGGRKRAAQTWLLWGQLDS